MIASLVSHPANFKTRKSEREWFERALFMTLFVVMFCGVALLASDAYAAFLPTGRCAVTIYSVSGSAGAGINPICDLFESLQTKMRGTTGALLAVFAIVALGLLALFGRLTWTQAMTVGLGVALVFGSAVYFAENTGTAGYIGSDTSFDPITGMLNSFISAMTGEGARAVGMVAVTVLGIGALFGKVSWIQGLILSSGIGLLFGATEIVNELWNPDAGEYLFMGGLSQLNPLAGPFMNIIGIMTGEMGISLATVGIMFLGLMAMIGRLSWAKALIVAAGIALMFGAADVVWILSAPLGPCSSYTGTDTFSQVICGFLTEVQGPLGRTVGTLAIMILGILALLGKISWELGLTVAVGIALVYGANSIITVLEASALGTFGHDITGVSCLNPRDPGYPSTGNSIADVLCYIMLILYGTAGKALATVAVMMMGFGALMGKVSYSQAAIVAAGIAVTFGAPELVSVLLPSASTGGCGLTSNTILILSLGTLIGC